MPDSASSILGRKQAIETDHRLLKQIEALVGLISYEKLFSEAGLTSGCVRVSESNADGNRYEIEVSSDDEMMEAKFREAVDLREFADTITIAGAGEFFLESAINFASFRKDWIAPLQADLTPNRVILDI